MVENGVMNDVSPVRRRVVSDVLFVAGVVVLLGGVWLFVAKGTVLDPARLVGVLIGTERHKDVLEIMSEEMEPISADHVPSIFLEGGSAAGRGTYSAARPASSSRSGRNGGSSARPRSCSSGGSARSARAPRTTASSLRSGRRPSAAPPRGTSSGEESAGKRRLEARIKKKLERANALFSKGKYARAEKEYMALLKMLPKNRIQPLREKLSRSYHARAEAYYARRGFRKAEELLKASLHFNYKNIQARRLLVRTYMKLGLYSKARYHQKKLKELGGR